MRRLLLGGELPPRGLAWGCSVEGGMEKAALLSGGAPAARSCSLQDRGREEAASGNCEHGGDSISPVAGSSIVQWWATDERVRQLMMPGLGISLAPPPGGTTGTIIYPVPSSVAGDLSHISEQDCVWPKRVFSSHPI